MQCPDGECPSESLDLEQCIDRYCLVMPILTRSLFESEAVKMVLDSEQFYS